METTPLTDVEPIAKHLKLELEKVRRIADLLEEGNTVPFITRFRKDHTGGLDEQQVRAIEKELNREKLLAERKETILKSIESRGQLTEKLADQIRGVRTLRLLEDIYLPYKPKKQSLASLARAKGLEPLAMEILSGTPSPRSLSELASDLVDEAKELPTADAVLEGVQHLLAEHFCNETKLRSHLRRHLWRSGKLVSKQIEDPQPTDEDAEASVSQSADAAAAAPDGKAVPDQVEKVSEFAERDSPGGGAVVAGETAASTSQTDQIGAAPSEAAPASEATVAAETAHAAESAAGSATIVTEVAPPSTAEAESENTTEVLTLPTAPAVETDETPSNSIEAESSTLSISPQSQTPQGAEALTCAATGDGVTTAEVISSSPSIEGAPIDVAGAPVGIVSATKTTAEKKKQEVTSRRDQRRETRRRRRDRLVQSFKDYFDFSDPIGRVPHHRILAINRGERTKVLRVKIECPDWDKFQAEAESRFVPQDHPHRDFLKKCFQYALGRLLLPSIEREVRRELNDKAEEHAVSVFARNLRKLLLQPPLCQHRVVAIDPGFRSGCKLVALDEFGKILGHTFINLLGKEQQKQDGRSGLINFVREHQATAIAIGNGAACRETEALVADVLTTDFSDQEVGYLIVNEAGTSVYSTSDLGREELPNHDATVRSAVSIGRRALDPLSELVKIDPASIGVGLYQHDVKAKHLRESLDAVVESCVNYVGVDVNSASPALLRYVSGLNSLTARRIFEHRQKHGPFKNREQLKEVSGIGNSTYVQAAGFLKVVDGENPLDETWIHPESYPIATKVLDAIGFDVGDLPTATRPAQSVAITEAFPSSPAAADAAAGPAIPPAAEAIKEDPEPAAVEPSVPKPDTDVPLTTTTSPAPAASADHVVAESVTSEPIPAESTTSESADPGPAIPVAIEHAANTGDEAAASGDAPSREAPAESSPPPDLPSPPRKSNGLAQELVEKLARVEASKLAPELGVGELLLNDILKALARPGRDPREDLPPPVFRRGILKLEDLKPGMELSGTVLNVVDFGAFVDIGLVDSGLIHVSRLADRYISDPHDVVSVGDILRVWVVEVDQKRRRVSLTAIEPGTERPKPAKDKRKPKEAPSSGRQQTGKGRVGRPKKFARSAEKKPKEYRPKERKKPVVPITKEMEEGKEPMRTFGDLKQLFDKKKKGGSN